MPELTPLEKLQPCLLDRLTDDNPTEKMESRESRVISLHAFRAAVLRDLAWLMNCGSHTSEYDILEQDDEAFTSVLNFGVRDVAGTLATALSTYDVEQIVYNAIKNFEPRIITETLTVKVLTEKEQKGSHHTISFEIHGQLWALPIPQSLFLRTEMDVETGLCEMYEDN